MFAAYTGTIKNINFSGPTYFSGILNALIAYARANLHIQMYHVLCILTDGAIHDFKDVKNILVEASTLPISVVIVGIGDEDFGEMEALDADEFRLRNTKGQYAKRDLV